MHDIKISAEALRAASNWAMEGENAAPVRLTVSDGTLFVYQGDDSASFDTSGTAVDPPWDEEPPLNQHLLAKLEILRAALKHLAEPNRGARPTGGDAIAMATFARQELTCSCPGCRRDRADAEGAA
jgi:hypothetical protein